MTLVTVRPTAGPGAPGGGGEGWTPVPFFVPIWPKLADNDDATGLNCQAHQPPYADTGQLTMGVVDPGYGRIEWVRRRLKMARTDYGGVIRCILADDHYLYPSIDATVTPDGAAREWVGPQESRHPVTHLDWGLANEQGQWKISLQGGLYPNYSPSAVACQEVYLDVQYRQLHTVTSATVSSTTIANPSISWAVSAPDSPAQPQAYARVLVWDSATYNAAGFSSWLGTVRDKWNAGQAASLADYPPVWDSGERADSSLRSLQIGTHLTNGHSYSARAFVSQPWPGTRPRWYESATVVWTVDLAPLNTPTLLWATADNEQGWTSINAQTGYSTGSPDPAWWRYSRSADGGVTWDDEAYPAWLFGLQGAPLNTPIFNDMWAPRGVSLLYRLRAETADNSSAWSNAVTVELAIEDYKLKYVDALGSVTLRIVDWKLSRPEPQGIDDVLGSDKPLVSSDGPKAWRGEMTIQTESKAEFDALEHMLNSMRVFLLQDVLGNQWYVRTGGREYLQMRANPDVEDYRYPVRHLYRVTVPWTEVAWP